MPRGAARAHQAPLMPTEVHLPRRRVRSTIGPRPRLTVAGLHLASGRYLMNGASGHAGAATARCAGLGKVTAVPMIELHASAIATCPSRPRCAAGQTAAADPSGVGAGHNFRACTCRV
eukprot:218839-Chlamydomonas_euryale.AAC.7